MGTRCLINFIERGETLATVYRQFDGYPDGMGDDLKDILGNSKIINGFMDQVTPEFFNVMGCLTAYVICELKQRKIGNVYIYPANTSVDVDYIYKISNSDFGLHMDISGYGENVYSGLIKDFDSGKLED